MPDDPPAPRTASEADARTAREAAALRENLRRRKAQARARTAPHAPASDAPAPDAPDQQAPAAPPRA